MRFLGLWLVSVALALAVSGAAVGASAAAVGCGSVITENTALTTNLRNCADGVVVAGSGITFDLAGHVISGVGTGLGVRITGQDVTVANGTITAFGDGVAALGNIGQAPPSVHLRSLKVMGNQVGVHLEQLGQNLAASSIESSQIARNATVGLEFARTNLSVSSSAIRANGSNGVYQVEAVGLFTNNDISQNGGNGIAAIDIYTFAGGLFGNTLNGNGGNGYAYGQSYGDAYPHLENNRADRNGQLGFFLFGDGGSWSNLDGGGNSAKGNGDIRQCVVQDGINTIPPDALVCNKNPGS